MIDLYVEEKKSLAYHLFINNLMQKIISVQESILTKFNLTLVLGPDES